MTRTALLLAACLVVAGWNIGRAENQPETKSSSVAHPSVAVVPAAHQESVPCASGSCCGGSPYQDCGCREAKSCLQKFHDWLCYCPHTPKCACPGCHQCNACCSGPLYTYFLCTPYPTAHVGDGFYIGQYPSTTDRPIMNAAYGSGFIELPPSAFVPQAQRYQ